VLAIRGTYFTSPPHDPQVLIADFFVVLGALAWLGVGVLQV